MEQRSKWRLKVEKSIQYGENTAYVFDLTFDDFLAFGSKDIMFVRVVVVIFFILDKICIFLKVI